MAIRPDMIVHGVADIDFGNLHCDRHIDYFLADVDNTLAVRGEMSVRHQIADGLRSARKQGFIRGLFLVSNTIWDPRGNRTMRVASIAHCVEADGFYCAGLLQKKPNRIPYQVGLTAMGATIEQTAFIGDQLYTDMAGAQALGLFSILVDPLGQDNFFTRINRWRQNRQLVRWYGKHPLAI